MGGKSSKGGAFEREVSKRLDLWWLGHNDDTCFWRSTQSGGRATTRSSKGQRTTGSYGDIAATNPVGEPLIKAFTIECKRLNGKDNHMHDIVDCPSHLTRQRPFEELLIQASEQAKAARSISWMLLYRRNGRLPLVTIPRDTFKILHGYRHTETSAPGFRALPRPFVRLTIELQMEPFDIVSMTFEDFLNNVSRQYVERLVAEHRRQ